MSKRFFAFGCSMTDYPWATWADALCTHYHNIPEEHWTTYNYGNSGMGNQHILDSLVYADLKHNFTDDDVICILWSSWCREDRIWADGCLSKNGSILNSRHSAKLSEFADNHFSLEHYVKTNVTAMHAANKAFNISWQAMIGANEEYNYDPDPADALLYEFCRMSDQLQNAFPTEANMHHEQQRLYRETPFFNDTDGHPNPGAHGWYAQQIVAPGLGITLNQSATDFMEDWRERIKVIDQQQQATLGRRGILRHSPNSLYGLEVTKHAEMPFVKTWADMWRSSSDKKNMDVGVLELLQRFVPIQLANQLDK